jgi:nucleotide-binding universal stress UspA family protein
MKILVPVDGSKASTNAVKYVVKLLKKSSEKSHVVLISIHDTVIFNRTKQFISAEVIDEYLRDLSDKDLSAARKILDAADVPHSMVIEHGNPAEVTIMQADKMKVDLIAMGAKGRSGFLDLLLGSVAQRVLSSAKQPVLLVK